MRNVKSLRGYFLFSTWTRIISSEVSFDSSEVSFDSSEEFLLAHVDIFHFPRGYFEISTWGQLALISNFSSLIKKGRTVVRPFFILSPYHYSVGLARYVD